MTSRLRRERGKGFLSLQYLYLITKKRDRGGGQKLSKFAWRYSWTNPNTNRITTYFHSYLFLCWLTENKSFIVSSEMINNTIIIKLICQSVRRTNINNFTISEQNRVFLGATETKYERPRVNFTNYVRTAFPPISFCQKSLNLQCKYRKAAVKSFVQKSCS